MNDQTNISETLEVALYSSYVLYLTANQKLAENTAIELDNDDLRVISVNYRELNILTEGDAQSGHRIAFVEGAISIEDLQNFLTSEHVVNYLEDSACIELHESGLTLEDVEELCEQINEDCLTCTYVEDEEAYTYNYTVDSIVSLENDTIIHLNLTHIQ